MVTNNITRFLDAKKIPYSAFELPAEKLGAVGSAQLLGVPLSILYKSIVVIREKQGKPILAVVPGDHEVNLKSLAAFLGDKKLKIPTQREAEQITGLQAGGISPLALINKGFQVVVSNECLKLESIHISGGQRGLNIKLPVKSLIQLTNARTGPISDPIQGAGDLDGESDL